MRELPPLLTDRDLMDLLGIRKSQFYAKKALGTYRHLEARPPMTGRTRYSGSKVQAWIEGHFTYARTFGRRAS